MEKRGRDAREFDSKYADFDNTLKNIDKKIKEGNVLGHNKVSAMAEQFANKNQDAEPKVQKSVIINKLSINYFNFDLEKKLRVLFLFFSITA